MSTGTRLPLADAKALADELIELLLPVTTRIAIAGSIRRKCPTIGDIEIVCVPKIVDAGTNLFGESIAGSNLLDCCIAQHLEEGLLHHRLDKNGRPAFGERYKRLLYKGVPLDLFSVLPPAQFGVIMAIRTGPAEFSKRFMTKKFNGGDMPAGLMVVNGALHENRQYEAFLVPIPEERDFFRAIGMDWIEPEDRR